MEHVSPRIDQGGVLGHVEPTQERDLREHHENHEEGHQVGPFLLGRRQIPVGDGQGRVGPGESVIGSKIRRLLHLRKLERDRGGDFKEESPTGGLGMILLVSSSISSVDQRRERALLWGEGQEHDRAGIFFCPRKSMKAEELD